MATESNENRIPPVKPTDGDIRGAAGDGARPLRIMQVTAPGRFGGLETVVRQLAVGLSRGGHEIRVCCRLDTGVDPASHPFVESLRREGVETDIVQLPHRAYLRESRALAELLGQFGADVAHTHGYHADVVGARAAGLAAVPRVATAHGFTGGGWKNRFYEYLQRRSYRSAAGVFAVSEPLARHLARDPRVAPVVRHAQNAWVTRTDRWSRAEARAALGLEPSATVVGWVGRMSPEKGPDIVLEAVAHADAGELVACMVGDGPMRDPLRSRRGSRAGARIVWTGAVADAGRMFAAFDLLVLSSRTEGTPMVLFEAMDAEVPIVAARVGGVPDVVGEAEALLVDPGDPSALRAAILELVRDPEGAARRARAAKARLSRAFGPEEWLAAHEALYRDALAGAGRR